MKGSLDYLARERAGDLKKDGETPSITTVTSCTRIHSNTHFNITTSSNNALST